MFLFHKRTKKVIKIVWGVFAVLIIVSMIFAYSGFVSLIGTAPNVPLELTEEELAQLAQDVDISAQVQASSTNGTTTVDMSELIRIATPTIESAEDTAPQAETTPTPPLRFGL